MGSFFLHLQKIDLEKFFINSRFYVSTIIIWATWFL